ncbi:hypothetical protein XPN_0529, partial [Xanthomonas arboricola pv. pruni MAFF 301427]
PGLERGSGSGTRRRTGPRLCGGRQRSAHAGAAFGWRGQGDQAPDRRLGRQGGAGLGAGAAGRHHHGRDRRQRAARHRHHGRDLRRLAGAIQRHRAGQPDRDADGRGHPAERCTGGRSHCRCAGDGRTGRPADRGSGGVQAQPCRQAGGDCPCRQTGGQRGYAIHTGADRQEACGGTAASPHPRVARQCRRQRQPVAGFL